MHMHRYLAYAPFEAFFTPDSAMCFTVDCKDGTYAYLDTHTYAHTYMGISHTIMHAFMHVCTS